jgi:hypothetical protein|tara:strand:+ start:5222 stop:5479 length:258 start_codon:yes stop_codon:yes gene_type:complete
MDTKIHEVKELIAERIPPGDNWELVIDRDNVIEGLVQALTQYMRKTKFKGHYRLEPLNGKLYALVEEVEILEEPEEEVWDIYGEN